MVDDDRDVSFFEFFFHRIITSVALDGVTTAIILDFVLYTLVIVKKYQGSFIKTDTLKNQKTNHLFLYSLNAS